MTAVSVQPSTVAASLNAALADLLEHDPRVLVFGEDLADPYGGAFKVTRGLSTRWPERVWNTPISEAGIVGVGTGLALAGYRPIVEIMFGDFVTLCVDQLVNTAAKLPQMFGEISVPLVVRTPMGGYRGYGPTHSQCLEKILLGVPGLTIVAPSIGHDAGELLRTCASRARQPVLFVEHKMLYPLVSGRPEALTWRSVPDVAAGLPIAVLANYEDESLPDVTLVSYGGSSIIAARVLTALAAEEVRAQLVLPSRIDLGLTEGLRALLTSAYGIVVCDEATAGFGWASEIAASLSEAGIGPVRRAESRQGVVPAARELESKMLLNDGLIREQVAALLLGAR